MEHTYFFAVDLGATSGRTILGCLGEGKMELKELTRFPNHIIETGGHYTVMRIMSTLLSGAKSWEMSLTPISRNSLAGCPGSI